LNVTFINCTYETFTPANSGAICTWIWEQCWLAELEGVCPLVISRSCKYPQHRRPNTTFIDYPWLPQGRVLSKLFGAQRRLAGWAHVRHKAYCGRVAEAIRVAGAERGPLVLSNDMELAVFLRQWFPDAFILHHFQNNNTSPPRFQRRFAGAVNVATACSDFAARWNEKYFGFPSGAIRTIYNAVDPARFRPQQDWNCSKPIVSFAGKTDPIKGPDVLLRAARRVASRNSNFCVQIVGRKFYDRDETDEYQVELQALATELRNCGVAVEFTGWLSRDRLPQVLGRAHIGVTPSRWDEPFGMVTAEAMACGMAMVGSRTGGTPEVIADAGFLYEREDTNELASHLARLLADRDLCRAYGQKARARAESLTWAHVWNQLRELLPASGISDVGILTNPVEPLVRNTSQILEGSRL
jgi:glycosyltransferase involved in cell wall biosynthesis